MKFFTAAAAMFAYTANTAVSAETIAGIVVASPDHTVLEAAVLAAPPSVLELLSDESASLTLFAPDDNAFEALIGAVGEAYVNALLTPEWSTHLFCVLASHVLDGVVPSSAITGPLTVTSLYGTDLSIDNVEGVITVDGNPVTTADIMASNGIVHSISGLPILPSCVTQSIVDIGSADETFSTLISLVVAAGLTDALNTTLQITLLAPTNEAFDDLPESVMEYLGSDVTALTEVLLYHVLPGNNFFGVPNPGIFETLVDGKTVEIEVGSDGITEINEDSDMIVVDILASNGVIQVIDAVLIPPGFTVPEAEDDGRIPDDYGEEDEDSEDFEDAEDDAAATGSKSGSKSSKSSTSSKSSKSSSSKNSRRGLKSSSSEKSSKKSSKSDRRGLRQ